MSTIAKEISENSKTGPCSATYSGKNTCPKSCPFFSSGCYGSTGPIGIIFNRCTSKRSPEQEAREEASKIKNLTGLHDLRIHATGDSPTNKAASLIAKAATEHVSKFGKSAWTYTHAWRKVSRKSWGKVSVLASCETTKQVKQAHAKGYATALIVPTFESDKLYVKDGVKILPCPHMTGKVRFCVTCRLCMDDAKLRKAGVTIAFKIHGPHIKATAALKAATA